MESKTYKIDRKSNSLDIVNLEYSNIDGYKIKPKVNKENTIKVDNIIFTNPSLIKKIIKKKINIKIKELLKELKDIEAGTNDSTGDIQKSIEDYIYYFNYQKSLMKAEKLRIAIIEKYVKYLGNTYQSLCLNKIQIIINELRYKLFTKINTNQNVNYIEFEENRKKGR